MSGSDHSQTFVSVTLTIKCGDITEEKCDAIVNGINDAMDLEASGNRTLNSFIKPTLNLIST